MVWKDSAIWFLHVQCSEGQPCDFWVRHKDTSQQLKVSKAWAVQYWRDSKIYWSKDLTDFMADALGLREGDLNPAWIPDVVPEVPVVPVPVPALKWWEYIVQVKDSGGINIGPDLIDEEAIGDWVYDNVVGPDASKLAKTVFYGALAAATLLGLRSFVRAAGPKVVTKIPKDIFVSVPAEETTANTIARLLAEEAAADAGFWANWGASAADQLVGVVNMPVKREILKHVALSPKVAVKDAATHLLKNVGEDVGLNVFAAASKPSMWHIFPDHWKWWIGALGGVMTTGFIMPWTGKESVWEADLIPFNDAVRDENWGIVQDMLPRLTGALDFYEVVVNTVGWLNPISYVIFKRGIDEARENIVMWGDQVAGETVEQGDVQVSSVPFGASIYVDGVFNYQFTDTTFRLAAGNYELVLKLKGFHDFGRSIVVLAGQTVVYGAVLKALGDGDVPGPGVPGVPGVPVLVPLDPSVPFVEPVNAWQYTITARDSLSGEVLHAKIIVNNVFTGDYTTDVIFLAPSSEYSLRLEAYGYEPAEIVLNTEALEVNE